jgi:phosphatidylserine decarboxylase
VKLTKYGRVQWLGAAVIGLPLIVLLAAIGHTSAAISLGVLWLAIAAFFRDPHREIPSDDGLFVAPADGHVTAVEHIRDCMETQALGCPEAIRVSIFLSVLDVHVNRAPCAMQVKDRRYQKGRFVNAMDPSSGTVNESNTLICQASEEYGGIPLLVRQIAGMIARRIVCEVAPGGRLKRGEQFGMIKFGSRTDFVVPARAEIEINARVGERVYGGVSVLARWRTGRKAQVAP